jgi:AraC-like DNA-binding protein
VVKKRGRTNAGDEADPAMHGGDARVGPILGLPSLLAERGVDPRRVFAEVGLDPSLLHDPENRISFRDFGRLLRACGAATGCPHFGLMAVERYDRNTLGAVGYLMRNSPTVGEALRKLQMHLHLNDRGAVAYLLHVDPDRVALVHAILWNDTPETSLIYDAAIGIVYKVLCELCGPSWKPLAVEFAHRPPEVTQPYRHYFGVNPRFDAERSTVVFASSWLGQPIRGADPVLRSVLDSVIRQMESGDSNGLAVRVRRALRPMVFTGTATLADTARLFALHERTLRRRLEAEGTSFHELLNEARFEAAKQLLRDTRLPAAEIAAILRYSNPGAFSRAFRAWSGASPRQRRGRNATGHP